MNKKFDEIDRDKPATFKQSWAVAYHFAKLISNKYPDFSEKKLANLIKGSIFYFHKERDEILTHGMVQDYLENKIFPKPYKIHLNQFLKQNKLILEDKGNNEENTQHDLSPPILSNTSNLYFDECLKNLSADHIEKLRWFKDKKHQIVSWTEIHKNGLAIIPKGIYKPSGWRFALSAKTTLAEIYDDGEIVLEDDLSWEVDYCPESQKDGSYAYTNDALKECDFSKIPIGYLVQVNKKPSVYRVMGPAIVQYKSEEDMFRFIGSSREGIFKIF
tara:strand:- start:70 stop:888 length:819 start_codon:yes stop_codon:yes gene_type:complete